MKYYQYVWISESRATGSFNTLNHLHSRWLGLRSAEAKAHHGAAASSDYFNLWKSQRRLIVYATSKNSFPDHSFRGFRCKSVAVGPVVLRELL